MKSILYGESCGVVVIETANSIKRKDVKPYAQLSGWAIGMDGNKNPNPSLNLSMGFGGVNSALCLQKYKIKRR